MQVLDDYIFPTLTRIVHEYNQISYLDEKKHVKLHEVFKTNALCEAEHFEYPTVEIQKMVRENKDNLWEDDKLVDDENSSIMYGFPYNISRVYYYFYNDYSGRKPTDEWVTMIVKIHHLTESQLEYWNSVLFDNLDEREKFNIFAPIETTPFSILFFQHHGTYCAGYGSHYTRYTLYESVQDLLDSHEQDIVALSDKTLHELFYEFQDELNQ